MGRASTNQKNNLSSVWMTRQRERERERRNTEHECIQNGNDTDSQDEMAVEKYLFESVS